MKLRTEPQTVCIVKTDGCGGQAEFDCNLLTPKEQTAIVDDVVSKLGKRKDVTDATSLYKIKIARIDEVIFNWRGVEDSTGQSLKCNSVNKEIVYNFNRDLIDEVLDEVDKLSDIRYQNKEEERKNSLAGQLG